MIDLFLQLFGGGGSSSGASGKTSTKPKKPKKAEKPKAAPENGGQQEDTVYTSQAVDDAQKITNWMDENRNRVFDSPGEIIDKMVDALDINDMLAEEEVPYREDSNARLRIYEGHGTPEDYRTHSQHEAVEHAKLQTRNALSILWNRMVLRFPAQAAEYERQNPDWMRRFDNV